MSEPETVPVEAAPEPTPEIAETPEQLPPEQLPPERSTKPVMVPVAVVADLREKKRGLEADNERLNRELTEARALAERLQRGGGNATDATAHIAPPATPRSQQPNEDVQRAAAEMVINRDIARVNERGMSAYAGQWNDTVSALSAFGVNTPDFLVDVIDIDPANAHQIMHDIAQDGERAVALASMSKARRIAEITKMTMAVERGADGKFIPKDPPKEPPKKVSQAPPPPPAVTPSASKEVDWRADNSSEDEFQKGFEEMMARRNRMGRR